MNIMKTSLLLLDNKIRKEDAGNTPAAGQEPVPAEKPEASMKALMFKGLQNLMANPALAEEVGVSTKAVDVDRESAKSYVAPFSSNLAFKSGKTKVLTATAAALAGMSLTSCIKVPESEPTKVTQIAIQVQDNEAVVAAIMLLSQQVDELKQQMAEKEREQAERDRQMLEAMNIGLTLMNNILEELANFHNDENQNALELRLLMMANNAAVVDAIATVNNTSKENAQNIINTIIDAYKDGKLTFSEAIAQIQDLFGVLIQRLDANFEKLFANHEEFKVYFDVYVTEAQKTNAQLSKLIEKANVIIANQAEQKALVIQISQDLKTLNGNVNYTRETLIKALETLGYTFAQYSTWNTDRMIEVIENSVNSQNQVIMANGDKIDQLSIELQDIINKYNNHLITEQQALELLKSIDQGVKDLNGKADTLVNLITAFRSDLQAIINIGKSISANTGLTAWEVHNLNNKYKELDNHLLNLTAVAIEVKNELKNGAQLDDSRIVAAIQALGLDVNAGKDQIIAALDNYIPQLQNIENAINKLDKNNQTKLDFVANLIKTITPNNQDVIAAIVDLQNANENNLSAATEKLAGKLDTLIALMQKALDKLDGVANNINLYGERLSEKFDINNDLLNKAVKGIDVTNASLAELQAEAERVKPLLVEMNNNIKIGDGYLEEISKKQFPALQEAVENIDGIGGGLTQAQLREELERYGKNTWDTYGGYFIQAGDQRNTIIDLLKKAGQIQAETNQNIINGFNKVGNDAEKLRKLVEEIRDYLPELKHECHLECHCPTIEQLEELIKKYQKVSEEVIGVLE